MRYELIEHDRWSELQPLMNGNSLPHPDHALIAVARDDAGEIKGMLVLQEQLHMEPVVLTDPHVNYRKMVEVLENAFNGGRVVYWAFAPSATVGRMAESVGMQQLPWFVYYKEV